jgi:integrase
MVFRRHGRPTFYLKLPTRTGWVQRSTDTSDRATARAMARMLVELGRHGSRAWDLLDAVLENRLTLGALFDTWKMDDLEGLRSRMRDVDLTSHIPAWLAWLADRIRSDTAQHYEAHLRTLMPEGTPFWRSQLTGPAVARWLATRTSLTQKRRASPIAPHRKPDPAPRSVSGSTKRKYLAAVQSFTRYLVEIGELATNPIRDVSPPPAAGPRCVFLELPDVLRLIEGSAPPYRAIFALAYGAGLEVSAILSLVDADIDSQTRQVRARGTKAWTRDRLARVADWAWPALQEHLASVLPGERVFRGLDRWDVGDVHRERLRALGLTGYRLHDARHHWAVRMARAGAPFELIARQLGHRDVAMVAKVYGRFKPDTEERDRWERIASDRDAEKWPAQGAKGAPKPAGDLEKQHEETPTSVDAREGYDSSRGGTRTRDPGIMSSDDSPENIELPSDGAP